MEQGGQLKAGKPGQRLAGYVGCSSVIYTSFTFILDFPALAPLRNLDMITGGANTLVRVTPADQPVKFVLNTHPHPDHVGNNPRACRLFLRTDAVPTSDGTRANVRLAAWKQ